MGDGDCESRGRDIEKSSILNRKIIIFFTISVADGNFPHVLATSCPIIIEFHKITFTPKTVTAIPL